MNWSDLSTRALINIWGEENIQRGLDGTRRNASIYAEIAQKLKDCGYEFSTKQIINKCKNLRRQYTAAKDSNNKSGNPPTEWIYFEEMDAIFGERPVSRPTNILDGMDASTFQADLIPNEPSELNESSVSEGTSNETGEEDLEDASLLVELFGDEDNVAADLVRGAVVTPVAPAVAKKRKPSTPEDNQDKQKSQTSSKSKKKAKAEDIVSSFTGAMTENSKQFNESHYQHQVQLQQNMFMFEERKRQEETEERRRDEERAHQRQLELFAMLGQMLPGRQQSANASRPITPGALQMSMPYHTPVTPPYTQLHPHFLPSHSSSNSGESSTPHSSTSNNVDVHKPWL